MNPSDLPEDPAEWPEDPYELLDVPPHSDERTVRRAYANLIRRFKPEQYPEQFRKIRSAYESIQNLRRYFGQFQIILPAEDSPSPEKQEPPTEDAPQETPKPNEEPDQQPEEANKRPRRRVTDELVVAWRLAEQNEPQAAHSALSELHERRCNNAETPLRLFWLEKVHPELAANPGPVRWLERAMMQSGLMGPASELYREELQERPMLAIHSGREFVHASVYPARLAEVTGWRWQAALRAGRNDVVRDEFAVVQERLREDLQAWLRLVFSTMEIVVWADGDSDDHLVAQRCVQETERLMHLNSTMAFEFDRNDMLQGLAKEWALYRDQRRVSPLIKSLVPLSWHGTLKRTAPAIREFVAQIVAEPNHWLGQFDYFAKPYPMSLYQIATAFEQYEMTLGSWPERPDANESLNLAMSFFQRRAKARYSLTRVQLLDYCIRESVRPEWLTAYLPTEKRPILTHAGRVVTEAVHNDHSLRLVCWAHCLFWAR